MRINITIPEEDLKRLDELAAKLGLSRSAMIREAIQRFPQPARSGMDDRKPEEILEDIRRIAAKAGKWDTAAAIRRGRELL